MNPTLNEKHRAELRASGIGDELIEKAGIRSVADDEIEALLGWKPKHHHWGTGWAIPFRQSGEVKAEYCRVKLDFPRNKDGKPVKYESPIKLRNRPYFPPGFWEALANARLILITEGEKKALSAAQAGFCCIGLVGVYGFQLSRPKTDNGRRYGQRELLPELAAIEWNGRQVVIVFDSDAAEKDGVKIAEHKLAEVLGKAGAIVKVVRLPADGDEKVGLDDYLVKHGVKGFNKILDDAKLAEEPPAPKALDWARICVDEAFTCPSGVKLRWWRDQFWVWFGKRYQIVPDGDMSARLLQWLDKHGADATPRLAHDVLECLRSEAMVPSPIEQPAYLDGDGEGNLIAMQNGLLNLDELVSNGQATLRPHTARWFSPQILPYSYDPKATCPNWLAFLADVFDGDEERIGLLQEWFGYCMTNDTSFQKIMLLEGPRRSGKGTTLRMLNQVVGEENVINPTLSGIAGQFALWGFLDKRVAVCADALLGHGERAMMVLERLLAISGEDSVEVHRKNLPSIPSVRLRVRFTLAVNELPRFGDNAGALASRLLVLPYRNTYVGREDQGLEQRLRDDVPGVFLWAAGGVRRLKATRRFTKPAASIAIERDFERLASPLKAFLDDCCMVQPGQSVHRDDLWRAWQNWCIDNGHRAGSRSLLGSRLRTLVRGLDSTHERDGDGRTRSYVGMSLNELGWEYASKVSVSGGGYRE